MWTTSSELNINCWCYFSGLNTMALLPEVTAGGGLSSQPWVDLEQVWATIVIVRASWPTSPPSATCVCCHGGSAIYDTHPEPGGVASACRTHWFPLTTQHLKMTGWLIRDSICVYFHTFMLIILILDHDKKRGFPRAQQRTLVKTCGMKERGWLSRQELAIPFQ